MIMNNLLTIVIPVKNEEKNLSSCLENVKTFWHVGVCLVKMRKVKPDAALRFTI